MGHDEESCGKLLVQLRKYKSKRAPFNHKFNIGETSVIWWKSAQSRDEWELQVLTLRLFAITSHSASCECSFSILYWFYGQRHAKLLVDKVEGMCKLHTYYITNSKKELPYYSINISENSLYNQILNSIEEINIELEGNFMEEDFNLFDSEDVADDTEIDTSQIYSLDVAKDIEIESQIFNMELGENEINETETSQRRQPVVLIQQLDYDIEALVAREIDNHNTDD